VDPRRPKDGARIVGEKSAIRSLDDQRISDARIHGGRGMTPDAIIDKHV
jgi:hypothetical protein